MVTAERDCEGGETTYRIVEREADTQRQGIVHGTSADDHEPFHPRRGIVLLRSDVVAAFSNADLARSRLVEDLRVVSDLVQDFFPNPRGCPDRRPIRCSIAGLKQIDESCDVLFLPCEENEVCRP